MLKPRKVPLRKCVATNEQHPKMDMFRIVRTPEGNIIIDLTGKARGRGAYLSKSKTAINQAKKKKVLDRHLETEVPESIYSELLEMLGEASDKQK
ncbi:MAG TPA: YlxR family protein [Bacilli bacterium]|jgi:predicted RNA-binding protein YlxR (DUF448 family)|nr:YlxR family protein [Acholeplasmataceae bacterium]OQB66218.1 MAG: hypothetical protein BWX94_00087 [Tenericutes bacterium ADurb.Bin140]HOE77273.1 YlxR family protein [Bacilli bacterium]HON64007.1 YlxR family protein [Bacilli bacterium]HOR95466.1 YlxR family protein [Bacilli bacterium]